MRKQEEELSWQRQMGTQQVRGTGISLTIINLLKAGGPSIKQSVGFLDVLYFKVRRKEEQKHLLQMKRVRNTARYLKIPTSEMWLFSSVLLFFYLQEGSSRCLKARQVSLPAFFFSLLSFLSYFLCFFCSSPAEQSEESEQKPLTPSRARPGTAFCHHTASIYVSKLFFLFKFY